MGFRVLIEERAGENRKNDRSIVLRETAGSKRIHANQAIAKENGSI